MNLPKGSELVSSNSEKLDVKGAESHTIIKLAAEGHRKLDAVFFNSSGKTPNNQLYIILENIRGTRDALVLSIFISLPEDEKLEVQRRFLAGSIGLYGLRRASLTSGANNGLGLTSMFDITQILTELFTEKTFPASSEIKVSIVPNQPLPDSSDIVVERVSIFSILPS